ncbi:DinB family protein [Dermabacteraceae bacterium P13077]
MNDPVQDEHGRPDPPNRAGEAETLLGFLDFLRATITWKVAGLSESDLRRRSTVSAMTLAGLLKHLTFVENFWFSQVLLGEPEKEPWCGVDWNESPDWEWEIALQESAAKLLNDWQGAVAKSRTLWRKACAQETFSLSSEAALPGGETVSARWILTHMVEEYARHCGHADLLREAIDGQTGE